VPWAFTIARPRPDGSAICKGYKERLRITFRVRRVMQLLPAHRVAANEPIEET